MYAKILRKTDPIHDRLGRFALIASKAQLTDESVDLIMSRFSKPMHNSYDLTRFLMRLRGQQLDLRLFPKSLTIEVSPKPNITTDDYVASKQSLIFKPAYWAECKNKAISLAISEYLFQNIAAGRYSEYHCETLHQKSIQKDLIEATTEFNKIHPHVINENYNVRHVIKQITSALLLGNNKLGQSLERVYPHSYHLAHMMLLGGYFDKQLTT